VELPDGAVTGESFTIRAVGELTVHGVTNQVTFTIDAQLVDDIAVVVGSAEIVFDDYDVTAPSAPIVLSVEDHGIVEFQLLFTR
jgi:polyisoprenoid-binding protein YceI